MTPEQDQALRDYLRESIIPLIEQVLVKKLGQAMTFAAEELIQPKRQWVGLTDEDKLMCWARATHDADVEHKTEHQCLMDYGTEIEAKLRSKNNG